MKQMQWLLNWYGYDMDLEEFYVYIEMSEYEFYHLVLWLLENKIEFRHPYRTYNQEDKLVPYVEEDSGVKWDHVIYLKTKEDYMAFKLRWL